MRNFLLYKGGITLSATNKAMISESVTVTDEVWINDKKVTDEGVRTVGEVEIIGKDRDGNTLFTKTHKNALLINGACYISEKENNRRSRFAPQPLDILYGAHTATDVQVTDETLKEEYVIGMVIGIQGCTNTYNTVRPVLKNALTVPGMIPFRVVPTAEDFTGGDRERYFLRQTIYYDGVEYAQYFGKVFDQDPRIDVVMESGDDVPNNISDYTDPGYLFDYTYYVLTINADDVREHFQLTDGNTRLSRINSLGLVAGYPIVNEDGHTEYYNVRCLTTVNFENSELSDRLSTLIVRYRWHTK